MIRFYIAASYAAKELMREHRKELHTMGHTVISRWLDGQETSPESSLAAHEGRTDLEDIEDCGTLLLFTEVPSTTGGRDVEFGYALARRKMLVIIGPLTNIFQNQAMFHYADWNDFRKWYPL